MVAAFLNQFPEFANCREHLLRNAELDEYPVDAERWARVT
jgi:hypothetical protein